jgi:hypothetical protein
VSPKLCPLCDAALVDVTTHSNNELQTHSVVGVVGVTPGMPSMTAICANGCLISVKASKTTDVLWARTDEAGKELKP